MEKRQEGIREQMETAAREKQDAIQFKAEYDEKIKNVQKETDEILSEARKKGTQERKCHVRRSEGRSRTDRCPCKSRS